MPTVDIPFPTTNAPGLVPGEGAGRLLNCYCYLDGKVPRWRALPGLSQQFTLPAGEFRGAVLVNALLYVVVGQTVYQVGQDQSAVPLDGAVQGSGPVTMERNNNVSPQVAVVSNRGAYVIAGPAVQPYPDGVLPAVASVSFLDGYFLFAAADGTIWATGLNTTTIGQASGSDPGNPLSFAKAEARPDGLLRGIVYGQQFLAMGQNTVEVWQDVGSSPFPLQRSTVIPVGLFGPWAVAGQEDGWGGPLIFVANDGSVRRLDGYTPTRISGEDLERLIGRVADPTTLKAMVYTFGSDAMWSLSTPDWTWEFNCTTGLWHERQSLDLSRWRADRCVKAFGQWLFGDLQGFGLVTVDETALSELGAPLVWGMDSGPVKQFPARVHVQEASFDFVLGQAAAGLSPQVLISWSRDGESSWSVPLSRSLGQQGRPVGPVRLRRLGLTTHHGWRARFRISDPVYSSFAGARASVDQMRA